MKTILGNQWWRGDKFNNERMHVGPIATDKEGTTLYITRTYSGKKGEVNKVNKKKYRTNNLELYIYNQGSDGSWKSIAFPYNNVQEYSVGHAALSPDDQTLYFISNMPGGFGGTDIWYSERQSDGSWGEPYNVGPMINTEKDEMFPSLTADGDLYFSSNGWAGMGGLDIFKSTGSKSNWNTSENVKYPVNSAGDDFAFVSIEANETGVKGFLSSNRGGGIGGDDIYSFSYERPKIILALKGVTYNEKSGELLPETRVTLFKGDREIIAQQQTETDGIFFFELEKDSDYRINGQKVGYTGDSTIASTKGIVKSDTLFVSLYLSPLFEVGKPLELENIHYDFDKSNIRKDAAEILDRLVRILKDNPTLKIELSSHTDSRGSDVYNMALSQRRARSAVNYLVKQGISATRMVAQGYGESRLLNHCGNGTRCSAAEHQANRRTEVTVLEF